jgi:hypothetical protein
MAFKSKSQRPTLTPEELVKFEENFISGAKADVAEAVKSAVVVSNEVALEPQEPILESSLEQVIEGGSEIQEKMKLDTTSIENLATITNTQQIDPYTLVKRVAWPITYKRQSPLLAEGRNDIDKQFVMRLKEDLWNSVELHCESLCIPKSEWVREAILRQLHEEQEFFLSNNNK